MPNDLKRMQVVNDYNALVEALKKTKFNKSKAADLLGIDRKTVHNILTRHEGLQKELA